MPITPDDWRWVMLVGAVPLVLGLFALVAVPESPRWLATRGTRAGAPTATVRPATCSARRCCGSRCVGIVLATMPMIGGWGTANWMIPWAEQGGQRRR